MTLTVQCDGCGKLAPETFTALMAERATDLQLPARWLRAYATANPVNLRMHDGVDLCSARCLTEWAQRQAQDMIDADQVNRL